ncbi:tape measure protein [Roseovarius ramblicola]|uniref:Tape measure protein n=1 Tax=Roseovarius ramblicola TaxID=2022336 RepID=A0ABV5HWF1_9RHOB
MLNVRARYDADAGGFVAGTKQARDELGRFRKASDTASDGLRGTGTSARRAGDQVERYRDDTVRARRETRGFGSDLSRLRGLIAGVGIGLLTREVFRTGLAAESLSARFRTATGSVEAGEAAMQSARATAERFGLDLVAVERGLSGLLAASRGTDIEDQATTIFEGVATAAAALQLPAEQVQGALTAIEQVMSKGKVQAEELRGQLGERIPGAFQIAARAMNVTTSELSDMLEAGEVLSEDFLPRFARQLREEFGEGARAAAQGATADFNRFRNELVQAQREFAQSGFLVGVTDGMLAITETLRDPGTQEGLRAFGQVLGDGLSFAAENAGDLGQAISALIAMRFAGHLVGWGRAARTAAVGLTGLRAGVAALGGPVGIGLAALTAGLTALPFLIEDNDEKVANLREATDRAGEAMERYAEASRQAARDQDELGGKVRATTQEMLNQSRADLQDAVRDAQEKLAKVQRDIQQAGTDSILKGIFDASLERNARLTGDSPDLTERLRLRREAFDDPNTLGPAFGEIFTLVKELREGGDVAFDEIAQGIDRFVGVGQEAREAARGVMLALGDINTVDLGSAEAQILRIAEGIGGLEAQIAAVETASDDESRAQALAVLADRLFEMADAAEAFREAAPKGFRETLKEGASTQTLLEKIRAALRGNLDLTEDTAAAADTIDFSGAASSASAMAGEFERAGKALAALQGGLIDLDFQNVGLEAEIAALEAGASEAEARIAGELARARAQLDPLIDARRGPDDGLRAPQAADAAEAALRAQEEALERRLTNQERRAALVRQLSPRSSGGATKEVDLAGDIVEEFGQRFGGTFDFATARIEEWRAATLASLKAAGLGHTELADMVDGIARDRLAEAYQEDLRNREDWAAGIERGLDDIFGTQLTMAEVAEDTVKAAFQGMEDAFVSLATTGKIETADLVDFALRQIFRLAAASATGNLGSAGGGIFGNLFSGLFNGLFSGPAPGSANSLQLHDGGLAGRDGSPRRVDPRVFDDAHRLHIGGLAGNEVPAILEDDERVLTLAQQQSTAATIEGLARLAAAPGAAPAASAAPANVNVRVFGVENEEEPRVETRQNGNDLDIDLIFREFEGRLGRNLARGRGLAPAIAGRFNLRGGM